MDAERLLGSLLRSSLTRRVPSRTKIAVGMGLLGVAMAAVEHFSERASGTAQAPPTPGPPPPPGAPPPPAGQLAPPPPPARDAQARLLIRTMIAAAAADGTVDAEERARVVERLEALGMPAEERAFVESEFAAPAGIAELVAGVTSPGLAEELYLAALLAVRVDTDVERAWLADLAGALALAPETLARAHRIAGVPQP